VANMLDPIKNTKKIKSLLTNLLHDGPLETTSEAACGPLDAVGQPCHKRRMLISAFTSLKGDWCHCIKIRFDTAFIGGNV